VPSMIRFASMLWLRSTEPIYVYGLITNGNIEKQAFADCGSDGRECVPSDLLSESSCRSS
jgi:hypothetical protein